MHQRLWTYVGLLLIVFSFVGGGLAQLDLDETYTTEAGTFNVTFPSAWQADELQGNVLVTGRVRGEPLDFIFFDTGTPLTRSADSAEELLERLDVDELTFIGSITIDGRDAAVADAVFDEDEGIAILIELDTDIYGLTYVFGSAETINQNSDLIEDVIATWKLGEALGDGSDSATDERPTQLNNVDGDWEDAVNELRDSGYIGAGGGMIFNENRAFFDGQGSWFTPLARRAQRTDIVMAGTLDFTRGSRTELETCSLLARIVDTGGASVETYLEVGFDNEGSVFYFDNPQQGEPIFDLRALNLDFDQPNHVLFIASDDRLTVFINGELIFDDVEIDERAGSFGIALLGRGANSRCEGTNIWAYEAPSFQPGVCEASTSNTVNKRSGPGTDFSRAGTLSAGTTLNVIGQATGSAGFVWWQLEDETWVREDVVSVQGDCVTIPQVNP